MESIELPIWLVFAYPILALVMYLLLVFLIRHNGPKRIFKSISSGKGDDVFGAFWQRYGPSIIEDAIKVGGPLIVNDLMSHMDAYLKGNVGQIKKQVFKRMDSVEGEVKEYVQSYFAQKMPMLSTIAESSGVGLPENPIIAKLLSRAPQLQKLEEMIQNKALSEEEKKLLNTE